ncbi:MAG: DUF6691 family protein [Pseudomonadota bacterium]
MRVALAFAAGSLFGLGLVISGMTDTSKVQGWLDILGAWDPTLAFVLAGAILPMALAWRLSRRWSGPIAGGAFPAAPKREIGRDLVLGALLFGAGWGLVGLCPGPALAALVWGGPMAVLFLAAMAAGMMMAIPARRHLRLA